jgi:YVTN family beta-propeller protein
MNKQKTAIVILLGAALFVFAACNRPSAPAESTQAPAAAESVAEQPQAPAAESAAEQPAAETAAETEAEAVAPQPASPWTVWVANGMDDSLSVIDVATGAELSRVSVGINPHILAASPDGQIIYVINAGGHDREPNAHAEGAAKEGEGAESKQDGDTTGHHQQGDKDSGESMSMGESGGEGAMAMDMDAMANSLWAVDAATGEILARIPVGMGPTHPIPSQDGSRVYVTNTDEGSVSVIDTATWEVIATIPDLPEPHDGELTPDGKLLYLATSGTSTVTVVDTATFQVVKTFKVGKKPRGLVVGGENGELVYVTNKGDGTLTIIDAAKGEVLVTAPVGAGAHAVRVSPDGKTAYVALSKENAVAVVDALTGEVQSTIPVGTTPEQIDLSSDGAWLFASNNGEASVSVIDLAKGEVVETVAVGQGAYGIQATPVNFGGAAATSLPPFAANADGFTDISVEQLATALERKNFTLVNVHIPYQGELPETDLFIPFDEITANLDKLPDQNAPIVLYCRSGSMSTVAAKALAAAGYTNVYELDGGFNAWNAAGYELVQK